MGNTVWLFASGTGSDVGVGCTAAAGDDSVRKVGESNKQGERPPRPCTDRGPSSHHPLSDVHPENSGSMRPTVQQCCYAVFAIVGVLLILAGVALVFLSPTGPLSVPLILFGLAMLLYGSINVVAVAAAEENVEHVSHPGVLPFPPP